MATYSEINDLLQVGGSSGLRERVAVGTLVAADAIRQEANDPADASVQQRKRFAQAILRTSYNSNLEVFLTRNDDAGLAFSPLFEAIYRSVLIANRGATVAQITSASDTAIQTAVDAAVDLLSLSFPDPVTP